MAKSDEAALHAEIFASHGVDTRSVEFRTVSDQKSALISDVHRIRSFPLLQTGVVVAGAVYEVETGKLDLIDA
jgi:carbonic anhydrase